ncbi:MAG: T9SS type A sorting domain-containing protein [Dysgonamonadaceae bacterium]|jgi:hypothetical protein|nr:T9SS type A sorting domain-containing protein [Dysgonamonadaceae bacterium]
MKRLVTVLISFVGYLSLFGQGAPMVVAGKVYAGTKLYSGGPVHLFANSDATTTTDEKGVGKFHIDKAAELQTNTIIFHSNNINDGLLKNDGKVKAEIVGVRKKFNPAVFTYFSLPFDVKSNTDIKSDDDVLRDGVDPDWQYVIYEFDAQGRATTGNKSKWKEVGNGAPYTLKKGTGYQFYNNDNLATVDFYTSNAADIETLFDAKDKNLSYMKHRGPFADSKNDGWAFIGSVKPSTFTVEENTIEYSGKAIYYRKNYSSIAQNSDWEEVILSAWNGESFTVSPFAPFYVQGSTVGLANGENQEDIFTFKQNGLNIKNAQYRSSRSNSNPIRDELYFKLASDKNNTFDRFYLDFADDYSEAFRAGEDAIKMATDYAHKPTVWSLWDGLDESLVVNGLPISAEREVKMGFSVPEAGEYTITLNPLHIENVRNVILSDNYTGKKVDLLQYPYPFTTEKVANDNSRFVLHINDNTYTGIRTLQADVVFASVRDNVLTIKNLNDGDRVRILDLTGRTVASGKASGVEFSIPLSRKGVYVVNVEGKTSAFKVLNK